MADRQTDVKFKDQASTWQVENYELIGTLTRFPSPYSSNVTHVVDLDIYISTTPLLYAPWLQDRSVRLVVVFFKAARKYH